MNPGTKDALKEATIASLPYTWRYVKVVAVIGLFNAVVALYAAHQLPDVHLDRIIMGMLLLTLWCSLLCFGISCVFFPPKREIGSGR